MRNWTESGLLELVRLYLRNERSFLVRRSVQRFAAGEITAEDAITRIREHVGARDDRPQQRRH